MNSHDILTPEQVEAAWKHVFWFSLDEHPDTEVAWEAQTWRAFGADAVAEIADAVLAERREADFFIPGGMEPEDLDRLFACVNQRAVLRLCRDEALSLIAATRLTFWAGLREAER